MGKDGKIKMIKLSVEDYCHGCHCFKPYVCDRGNDFKHEYVTDIRCVNADACKWIHADLRREMNEEK